MASGTINLTTNNSKLAGKIVWSSTSNGTEANSSNVTASIYVRRTDGYTTKGTWKGEIDFAGSQADFSKAALSISSDWVLMQTLSKTVSHASNGTGSVWIHGECYAPSGTSLAGASVGGSQTVTLDTIPRQANITGAPNFTDEDNPTITYSNPAGNSVNSLQACVALNGYLDILYRDIPKTGTSYTFYFTEAERENLRKAAATSNTFTATFYVKTKIGDKTYHSTLKKTLTIINNRPTLYPIIEDTNSVTVALTGNASKMVKYFSCPEVATGATAYKHATITQQAITNGNKKTTNSSDIFYNVENHIFAFWAKDSRGNEIYQEINKINEGNWIDYVKITCNASPTNPTTDGKMFLNVKGNYWNGNFGAVANYLTLQYRMGIAGQSFGEWITVPAELDGNTYNASIPIEGLNYQTNYAFEVRALDKLETTPTNYFEVQTAPVFDWGKNDFRFNVDTHGWFSSDVKDLPDGSGDGAYWRSLKAGTYWYASDRFNVGEMPNPWGFVVKVGYVGADYSVMFYTQAEGQIFRRSGNFHSDSGWREINSAKVLYHNSSGSNGTITLNETTANFSYIEIFYKDGMGSHKSVKCYNPDGKTYQVEVMYPTINNMYTQINLIKISGTSITRTLGIEWFIDNNVVVFNEFNYIYMTKVVGYR